MYMNSRRLCRTDREYPRKDKLGREGPRPKGRRRLCIPRVSEKVTGLPRPELVCSHWESRKQPLQGADRPPSVAGCAGMQQDCGCWCRQEVTWCPCRKDRSIRRATGDKTPEGKASRGSGGTSVDGRPGVGVERLVATTMLGSGCEVAEGLPIPGVFWHKASLDGLTPTLWSSHWPPTNTTTCRGSCWRRPGRSPLPPAVLLQRPLLRKLNTAKEKRLQESCSWSRCHRAWIGRWMWRWEAMYW